MESGPDSDGVKVTPSVSLYRTRWFSFTDPDMIIVPIQMKSFINGGRLCSLSDFMLATL